MLGLLLGPKVCPLYHVGGSHVGELPRSEAGESQTASMSNSFTALSTKFGERMPKFRSHKCLIDDSGSLLFVLRTLYQRIHVRCLPHIVLHFRCGIAICRGPHGAALASYL